MEVSDGNRLKGKIQRHSLSTEPSYIQILLNENLVATRLVTFANSADSQDAADSGLFQCDLPKSVLDGREHKVSVNLFTIDNTISLNNPLTIQAQYVGQIDYITTRKVVGWVANLNAPGIPVDMDVYINGKQVAIERASLPYPAKVVSGVNLGSRIGFDIDLPLQGASNSYLEIEIKVSGCDTRVFYESQVFTAYDTILRSLEYCAQQLNKIEDSEYQGNVSGIPLTRMDTSWVRENLLAPMMQELRQSKSLPATLSLNLNPAFKSPQSESDSIIDVIIPVYKGMNETMECITRALKYTDNSKCEVIVINDHSPEPELTLYLKKLASAGQITLIENPKNLGFVKSVNLGMRLHHNRDVVLLNSDALVPSGWLDRMHYAAYSDENIGTVTPFTNNGTICSFPETCKENTLPDGMSVDAIDQIFESMQAQVYDIPTAVGFCMYIKRKALDEAGYFDESTWKKGYGEENDFCLRAGTLGWRSVVATNLFVQHIGSVSFSSNKDTFISENFPKLTQRYPDYEARVNRFIKADPLAAFRNPVVRELLKTHSKRYVLFVVHGLGGGAGYAAQHLSEKLNAEGESVLVLSKLANQQWEISCANTDYRLVYQFPQQHEQMLEDLRALNVWHVHYHQTMDFEVEVLDLANRLAVTYDFTAHDFMPICPRINFVDETDRFCGDARFSADACNQCIKFKELPSATEIRFKELGSDVNVWRLRYANFLKGARRVIAPSNDTAMYYKQHFSLDNLIVKAHPEQPYSIAVRQLPLNPKKDEVVCAVIGGIGLHKGFNVLISCAQKALKDQLPIKFVVIGHTYDDEMALELPNIEVTGEYQHEALPNLIQQHGCRVALFLSTWPETFSYTLSEAWQHGLYPISYNMGAIAERIKDVEFGELFDVDATPEEINKLLLMANSKVFKAPEKQLGYHYDSIVNQYYEL